MIYPGPYLCMMCGKEPKGERRTWWRVPFEVDDGLGGTTKDEAWIYCQPCDTWTAFAPIPDEPQQDQPTTAAPLP